MKHTLTLWTLPSPNVPPGQPTPRPDALRSTHLSVWSLSAQLHKGAHVCFKYMGAVTSLGLRFREGEGGWGEGVNETWVTQLLSEAENSLWPKPWVSFPPHQLQGPWRTISPGFCICQLPLAHRDQFVDCAFLIKWWEQEQKQGRILHLKSFFQAHSPDLPGNQCKVPAYESWTISGRPLELEDTGHCSREGNSELKIRVMGVWNDT